VTGEGITRRQAMAATAASTVIVAASPKAPQRPNILWLVSEDNGPFIGAYGDGLAHTPTIDALARRGILFRNVYANAPVCAPSRFAILTGVHPESSAPANHMRARALLPDFIKGYPTYLREAGYWCTNAAKTDYNCAIDPEAVWDQQGNHAHWRSRPTGKPFMAVFNYETTHESRLFRPTPGRVTPAMVRVPAYLPDTPAIRQDFASYYNLMEMMDSQLAERLTELDADGLTDDTIIFYYSDNGGALPRSKRYCYDEGMRCALIVAVPPRWMHWAPVAAGGEVRTPVSGIDLPATVLRLAGLPLPPTMQGKPLLGPVIRRQPYAFGIRDRMDERYDFVRTVSDGRFRYIRNYLPHRPWGQHVAFAWLAKGYQSWESEWRAGRLNEVQARFFGPKPYEELYDLAADPDQIINLANTLAHCATKVALSRALDRHMLKIRDNGFLPEAMAGEGWIAARDEAAYPLKRLMVLARAAAQAEERYRSHFRRALRDGRPVMRYWGAMGLLRLGGQGARDAEQIAAAADRDISVHVRIVAGEALALAGEPVRAAKLLAAIVDDNEAAPVKLQALGALTVMGQQAQAALPAVSRAALHDDPNVRSAGRYLQAVLSGNYTPTFPVFDVEYFRARAGAV
jgi:arylsulfatase A-like enzyme